MGQGRHVAPVPLWASGVAALALSDFGNESQQAAHLPGIASGDTVVGIALAESGANDVMRPAVVATTANGRVTVRGFKPAVPFAQHASLLIVPVLLDGVEQILLLDPNQSGITRTPVTTTNHEPHAHVDIDTEVSVDAVLGHGAGIDGREALRSLFEHSLAALAAIQVGVAEGSLALTASHLSGRTQFGKPLSAFQATTQRAADGYITTEAMRVTSLNAAWRLAEGFDARRDVAVAAYWASEGAQQVVTAAQHLHGGIGADVDYPVHRYFLWGIQLASVLGSASAHLSRLGNLIART
jgi:acyl-CoA dehydrogenase